MTSSMAIAPITSTPQPAQQSQAQQTVPSIDPDLQEKVKSMDDTEFSPDELSLGIQYEKQTNPNVVSLDNAKEAAKLNLYSDPTHYTNLKANKDSAFWAAAEDNLNKKKDK